MADSRANEDLGNMPEGLDIEERFHGQGNQGGGRGRGKGGRGGRGGGGGKGPDREVAVSKALSKLLRHAADDAGIKLDAEGYARLDEVVSLMDLPIFYQKQKYASRESFIQVP